MKKSLLLFIFFFCAVTQAQIVIIPDPVFKAQLLSHDPVIDTDTDGEIQVSEALAATEIGIAGAGITDLTGIAAFSNITFISCSEASVTTADFSMLGNLNSIYMPAGQLTSLTLGTIPVTSIDVGNKLPDETTVLLDLGDRQSGVYFIKVITEKGFAVEKIIKN